MVMALIQIPQELIDLVIDYSYSHKPTLVACSLVCKAWLPSARYHLFSTVYLIPRNAFAFLELLESPLATIQPFVRTLTVANHATSVWFNEVIVRLRGLSAVTSLHIRPANRERISGHGRMCLHSNFGKLVELEIYAVFNSFNEVTDLICSFPFLEILELRGRWNIHSLPTPDQHILSSHLHTLGLGGCPREDVLKWLSLEPISTVSTLHLRRILLSELPCIGEYLRVLGSSLQHLTLTFTGAVTEGIFGRNIDLIHNTELRSIHVNPKSSTVVEFVIAILSQIDSPNFEELVFPIQQRLLDDHPWAELDRVATRPHMAHLQVTLCGHRDIENYIREQLPKCEERGILLFFQQ